MNCPLSKIINNPELSKELNICKSDDKYNMSTPEGIQNVGELRDKVDVFLQEQMNPEVGRPSITPKDYNLYNKICQSCYNTRLGGKPQFPK